MPIKTINGETIMVGQDGIEAGTALRAIKTNSTITDFNSVPLNTILSSNTNTLTANRPPYNTSTAFGFMVITFSPNHATNQSANLMFQLCITTGATTKDVWYRMKHGGGTTWANWAKLESHDAIEGMIEGMIESYVGDMTDIVTAIKTDPTITDFDLVPLNTILSSNTNTITQHIPPYDTSTAFGFMVVTLSPHNSTTFGSNLETQVCVVTQGSQAGDMYIRVKHGGSRSFWRSWRKVSFDGDVKVENYFDLSMFPRIAACGDSYCGGSLHTPDGTSLGLCRDASWATQAARQVGCECTLYAVGGRGAYNFINDDTENLASLLADATDNPYDLILLEFGINDSNPTRRFGGIYGGQDYIGSSADINEQDPTQNANSFWGNMSRIIAQIKETSPACRIALVGLMRRDEGSTVRYATYNQAVKDIADYHGVLFIDMYNDSYMFTDVYNANIYGGHPTYIGYNGIARALNRQFSISASGSDYISRYYGPLGA